VVREVPSYTNFDIIIEDLRAPGKHFGSEVVVLLEGAENLGVTGPISTLNPYNLSKSPQIFKVDP